MGDIFAYPGDVYEVVRERYHDPEVEVEFLESYGIGKNSKVLDIGCGTGTLLRALAKRGVIGHGIDPSASFIEFGLKSLQGQRAGRKLIRLDVGHALALEESDAYDAVVCNFNVLSYLPDMASVQETIRHAYAVTKPGGHAIFEIALYLNYIPNFKEFVHVNHVSEKMFVNRQIRHVVDVYRGLWIHEENIFVNRGGGKLEHYFETYRQLIIIPAWLASVAEEAGFTIADTWSDWKKGKKIGPNSTCTFVLRKE